MLQPSFMAEINNSGHLGLLTQVESFLYSIGFVSEITEKMVSSPSQCAVLLLLV